MSIPDDRPFEVEVIDRLARIETRLENLSDLPGRVASLESHRNWAAGFVAAFSALAGYLHFFKS